MKRSKKRFFKKNKTALIFVVIIIFTVFFILLSLNLWPNLCKKTERKTQAKTYMFEQYYVPVSHYTDSQNDISYMELKNMLTNGGEKELFIDENEKENIQKLFKIDKISAKVNYIPGSEVVNRLIEKGNRLSIVPFSQVTFKVKSLKVDGRHLWDKGVTDYPLKLQIKTSNQIQANNSFDRNKITLLTNLGDVILGRHVAYKMRTYNDYSHPWLKMADFVKKGDITFADLETPLSDRIPPPDEGMSFIAPQKAIAGLKLAGIDVVALANNHSTNYGINVFGDTLTLLNKEGIKYVGGGVNAEEAYKPLIVEKNGLKFAFIDFNSIIGAINATDDSPGVAKFAIKPWAETDDQNDIQRIKANIISAKKQADIVVVEFHWGVEYKVEPIQSQIDVAYMAIDSGADLIIGTHPHVVQAMDSYKNVPIFYSLGNFIFDQEWSIETKQGIIAETYFYNKKLVSAPIFPYQIEDYNQPQFVSEQIGQSIQNRIYGASKSAEFRL